MKFKSFVLLLGICVLLLVGCSGTVPIQDYVDAPIIAGSDEYSLADVKQAIIIAGRRNDWRMKDVSEGHIVGTHLLGDAMAQVDIRYTLKTYNIHYKASTNMKYNGSAIDKKYAMWIEKLSNEINKRLMLI